jgi:glucose-1-phosphate thymidylyltransferase
MGVSKQLLPVYDKPMIYYPLSTLMLAGIRDILLISTPHDLPRFRELFNDGANFGVRMQYAEQPKPVGLADAFIVGREFIGKDSVCMILGDNIFFGHGLPEMLKDSVKKAEKGRASVFGYRVCDPERFANIEFDKNGKVLSIVEKPPVPKTNFAAVGIYFFDNSVVKYAPQVKPSARGELEITSLLDFYLSAGKLDVQLMGRGFAWLDSGTYDSLIDAGQFVQTLSKRQGLVISAIEEIGYSNGWITREKLLESAEKYKKTTYGEYLARVAKGEK